MTELQKEDRRLSIRYAAIVPLEYRDFDIEQCKFPRKHADVLRWQYGPRGLLLLGKSGTGKTRSVAQLVRRLLMEGRTIVYLDSHTLSHSVSTLFLENAAEGVRYMEALTLPDVLILDDMGKAIFTERMLSEFFAVVERRAALRLPFIITTNETEKQLLSRMKNGETGLALIRRIQDFTDTITFQ